MLWSEDLEARIHGAITHYLQKRDATPFPQNMFGAIKGTKDAVLSICEQVTKMQRLWPKEPCCVIQLDCEGA